ncbi:hypothetical protein AA313_de0204004 [Arthrobotrys entomopaga]|nr:hypothetical protein AA313_de0204004 [Arthrobotrys entomopaga]
MPAIRNQLSRSRRVASPSGNGLTISVACFSSKEALEWAPLTPGRIHIKTSGSNGLIVDEDLEDKAKIGQAHAKNTFEIPKDAAITDYQKNIYDLLLQIPPGKVSTYKYVADALRSGPRAVGTALRRNPFAPDVPCHRVIASTHYVGGFLGDWEDAPSGINQTKKLKLLKEEGVEFDDKGYIKDRSLIWKEFDISWQQQEEKD